MKRFAITSLLLALAALPAIGQDLGFMGSYGVGIVEGSTASRAWSSWCNCDQRGSSLTQQAFVAATLLLHNNGANYAAQASVGIGTGVASFVSPAYPAARPDMPNATLEFRETLRTIAFRADVVGRLAVGGDVWIAIGPWLESLLQSTLARTEHTVSPPGTVFPDASSERVVGERNPGPPPTVRWGLSGGVSASVEVSRGITLVPQLLLQANLPAIASNQPGALLLTGGSAVVFDIGGGGRRSLDDDTPLVLPDIESSRDDLPRPPPRATLDVYALHDGTRIQTANVQRRLTYRRVVVAMPRTIEFVPNSRTLNPQYRLNDGPLIIDRVLNDPTVGDNLQIIDSMLIEILGARMRSSPATRIRLVAMREQSENRIDAIARADVVRDYLVNDWSIDRKRIVVADTNIARNDVASVHISSAHAQITTDWCLLRLR